MSQTRHDPERVIDLDLVRCTEAGALSAWKWFGKGEKEKADAAATDAIRGMFELIDCKGLVRIGEGRKDNAPGIFVDEKLGSWTSSSIPMAIAVDPVDGTTLTAKGLPGAISVLAVTTCEDPDDDPRGLFPAIPSHYMDKLAVGPRVAAARNGLTLDAPLEANLKRIAKCLDKRVEDIVCVVLDRPRHSHIIEGLRANGCRIRLISDGDVAAAIAPSMPDSGVDLYLGIGGSPEAVLSAAAIKCLGGEQLCRIWPKNDEERAHLAAQEGVETDLDKVWTVEEMAQGDHIIFVATGISDSTMLRGLRYRRQHCITESILMRSRNRTVRRIETYHNIASKTLRLASTGEEMRL